MYVRTGKLSIFLGAPAMFFWGIGTSDIGSTSVLNWSPALSATAMAVRGPLRMCVGYLSGRAFR